MILIYGKKQWNIDNMNKHKIPRLDEDFYNPFEDDQRENVEKPKHLSDQGGMFRVRRESFSPSRIEFSKTSSGNYTVIARSMFYTGEIVEIAPIIFVGIEAQIDKKIKDTVFEIDKANNLWGIVLGYGSIYRHSSTPNLDFAYNSKSKQMYFIAKRLIRTGEELTIDYGKDWWDARMSTNFTNQHSLSNDQGIMVPPTTPMGENTENIQSDLQKKNVNAGIAVGSQQHINPANTGFTLLSNGQS